VESVATMVKTAVILAAGNGSRLATQSGAPAPSKPLTLLAGVPLVVRTLLNLQNSGFQRAVVVTGYRAEEVEWALANDPRLTIELAFARNERWKAANGVSVLAARPFVDSPEFYLLMSDHIFERAILDRLAEATLDPAGALLAVDRKLDEVFDMDDATKVQTDGGREIIQIGKQLTTFDAVDTGVFRCSRSLFDALAAVHDRKGDCSLSDGIGTLARGGHMHVVDVGSAWWQDVDTPEAMAHARTMLLEACLRSPDGIVAPNLGRPLAGSVGGGALPVTAPPRLH